MDRPKLEVADVFRRYGDAYRQQHGASLSVAQRRVMTAIELCRTAALGGHLERCDQCGHERNAYNSCRESALPKMPIAGPRGMARGSPAPNFSTPSIFMWSSRVPEQIAAIAYQNKEWSTASCSAPPPRPCAPSPPTPSIWAPRSASSPCSTVGVRTCFTIRICIVSSPAAASRPTVRDGSPAGPDSSCRSGCSRVCSAVCSWNICIKAFDAGKLQFFSSLEPLRDRDAFLRHLAPARAAEWVVYAKRPFAGPEQVLDYVGRYTHRVAISNNRLLDIDHGKVRFR